MDDGEKIRRGLITFFLYVLIQYKLISGRKYLLVVCDANLERVDCSPIESTRIAIELSLSDLSDLPGIVDELLKTWPTTVLRGDVVV